MKCFEKFVISLLEKEVSLPMSRTGVLRMLLLVLVILFLGILRILKPILFVDFSSAFNTVQTQFILEKLHSMGVSTLLIKCFFIIF